MPQQSAVVTQQLENILTLLMRRETLQRPQTFYAGMDVNAHVLKVEEYASAVGITDTEAKLVLLLSTLDGDAVCELRCQLDYSPEKSYEWHCDKLKEICLTKDSEVSPFMLLLDIKQGENQSLRSLVT